MRPLSLALLATLSACGKDTPNADDTDTTGGGAISGLYEVSRESFNEGCGGRGTVKDFPIPFIRLTQTGTRIDLYECRSETDCNAAPTDDWAFDQVDGEWIGESHGGDWSNQESACFMWYQERAFTLDAGEARLERREYDTYDATVRGADACAEKWPDWSGRGGTCKHEVKIDATRIGD